MSAATKTMVELFGLTDCERWRFFAVKRTAGDKIGAGFLERNMTINRINDIHAIEQVMNKRLRNHLPEAIQLQPASSINKLRYLWFILERICSAAKYQLDILFLISAETFAISARPASLGFSMPITLPISCMPAALVSEIASVIRLSISESLNACGI